MRNMDGQLLDVGNDRFRATLLMKNTRAIVGWALANNPDADELREEESRLRDDFRSARGFLGHDEEMCLAIHLVLGERFIYEPETLSPQGTLIPISRSELKDALAPVRLALRLLPEEESTEATVG